MSFRDGLFGLAKEPPFEILQTKFGPVKVQAPLAGRVDEFRRALGDKGELAMTPAIVAALACHDVETGVPLFSPKDIPELNRVPVGSFNSIIDAVQRVGIGLSLDPTTPATEIGSDSRPDSDAPSSTSASG